MTFDILSHKKPAKGDLLSLCPQSKRQKLDKDSIVG